MRMAEEPNALDDRGGGTTPRTTTPTVVVPAPHDPIGAQQEDDDDLDDDIVADQFINTLFGDADLFVPRVEKACYEHDEAGRDPDPAATKPAFSTRLFTPSQELSPAACAFTEPQADAARRSILSPSTLHKAATEQIKVGACSKSEKKKGQKRKKSTSSSQPLMPIRDQDGPPSPKDLSYAIHVAGRPMLPPNMLDIAT